MFGFSEPAPHCELQPEHHGPYRLWRHPALYYSGISLIHSVIYSVIHLLIHSIALCWKMQVSKINAWIHGYLQAIISIITEAKFKQHNLVQ